MAEERFIVVKDQSKRAKVCRGRHGGGYTLVATFEPGCSPTPEAVVALLNAADEMKEIPHG